MTREKYCHLQYLPLLGGVQSLVPDEVAEEGEVLSTF